MRDTDVRPRPWTPPSVRLVLLVLALIVVANVFDVCATLVIVGEVGASEEMNPLMRAALEAGPATFIAAKMGLVCGLTSFLAVFARRRRTAWIGLCLLAAVYMALIAFQTGVFFIRPPPGFR